MALLMAGYVLLQQLSDRLREVYVFRTYLFLDSITSHLDVGAERNLSGQS